MWYSIGSDNDPQPATRCTGSDSAVTHQKFVGTGYFDELSQVISGGTSSTTALSGSTEEKQFHESKRKPARAAGASPERSANLPS